MPAPAAPMIIKTGSSPLKMVATGVGIALAVAAVIEGRKLYKEYKDKQDLKRDQGSTIKPKPGGKLFDIIGRPITSANLATIAVDLDNALSWPADQERAVRVFQTTPFGSVPALEQLFMDKGFGNLRQRMVNKLSDANWIKVKYNFR